MIIIGDVHGCYDTLVALLDKIPQEEKDKGVVFCGDLIDRGPKSKQVIELVRNSSYKCVKGNHEILMIDCGPFPRFSDDWGHNGGNKTVKSYYPDINMNTLSDTEQNKIRHQVQDDIRADMKWLNDLPVYLEFPEVKNDEGRYLVVSHSHVANVWRRMKQLEEKILKTPKDQPLERMDLIRLENCFKEITWGRPQKLKMVNEIYNVIGHTPRPDNPRIKKPYANVDTGCFLGLKSWRQYSEGGLGKLTALQFPEMIVYQQDCIDEFPEPKTVMEELDDE